jgi:hypothetical protein
MNKVAAARVRLAEEALLKAGEADPQLRGNIRYLRTVVGCRIVLRDIDNGKPKRSDKILSDAIRKAA